MQRNTEGKHLLLILPILFPQYNYCHRLKKNGSKIVRYENDSREYVESKRQKRQKVSIFKNTTVNQYFDLEAVESDCDNSR